MTQEGQTPATPSPCKTLAVSCCIALIDCINATILNPYVDDMVSMLLKTERGSPDVSSWVSVLVGSYSLCEVGRRPVSSVGLTGSAVAPIIFGMAGSLPVALGARLMDGFFCGNIGVVRTYSGELVDNSNEAKAFGILAATFSLGSIIGPTLGGSLAYPARWYPATFQGTIFDTHPFSSPNLSYACSAIAALLVGFFALPESRARVQQQAALLARSGAESEEFQAVKFWQGFPKGRNFRQILIASSLLNGYVAACLNAFVSVSSLPETMGGMASSPHQFGYIQVCAAAMIFSNQATFYPILMRRFGMHRCFVLCLSWTIAISLPIPLYYMVADPRFHFWRYVPITAWQMLSQFGLATCFPVAVMLVNRECSVENRGSVNGWCNSLNALSRGLGPPSAGGLFRLGCYSESSSFQSGRYLPFYVNMITAVVCIRLVAAQSKTQAAETAELPS